MGNITTEATPEAFDPRRCLGKRPPKFDERTLRAARYISPSALRQVPKTHTLSKKTRAAFPTLGMMGNDDYADCAFAAPAHGEQAWSAYGGDPWRPTDPEIVGAYLKYTGGVDSGAYMLDVLNILRHEGLGTKPDGTLNTIYAFAAVDITNHAQAMVAHYLFGGLYVGANLPWAARTQKVWDVGTGNGFEPGSWGGHAMHAIDYSPRGITFVTWGELQLATWAWIDRYCDEAYAILEEDFVGSDRRSPQGFSLKRLERDLKAL